MYQNVFQVAQAKTFQMMFAIINIIDIIGKFHAGAWPWLQDDAASSVLCLFQIWLEADIQWYIIILHAPGCSRASFWSFPSNRRFPHCHQQSSLTIILWGKLCQCDRINITGVNGCCHQKKTLSWNHTSLCKLQSSLNSAPFSQNTSKLQLRNMQVQQLQIFLI